jgi:hypothetical protein
MPRCFPKCFPQGPPTASPGAFYRLLGANSQQLPGDSKSPGLVIYTKMEVLARLGNVPSGFINRTTWAPQTFLAQPLIEMEMEMWDQNQLVPGVEVGRWVDIVVNKLNNRGHPFHLVRDPSPISQLLSSLTGP